MSVCSWFASTKPECHSVPMVAWLIHLHVTRYVNGDTCRCDDTRLAMSIHHRRTHHMWKVHDPLGRPDKAMVASSTSTDGIRIVSKNAMKGNGHTLSHSSLSLCVLCPWPMPSLTCPVTMSCVSFDEFKFELMVVASSSDTSHHTLFSCNAIRCNATLWGTRLRTP